MKLLKKEINYLIKLAGYIAANSPDEETKVGCILVDDEKQIVCSAFNNFCSGAPELPKTRPDKYEYMIHAEVNTILYAASRGVRTLDLTLVQTLSPCPNCCRIAYQAGIHEIYFKDLYRDFDKTLNMKDLNIKFTKVGQYYRIKLRSKT